MEDHKELFERYLNNECTRQETADLFALFSEARQEEALRATIQEHLHKADEPSVLPMDLDEKEEKIYTALLREIKTKRVIRLWPRRPVRFIAAAASVIFILSFGAYLYLHNQGKAAASKLTQNDLEPGGSKAILTLANGRKITLTNAKNGQLAQQSGIIVTKTKNGQLIYIIAGGDSTAQNTNQIAMNTLETPKGGEYQVILPDGTHVWLNAASKLEYPAKFTGNERMVRLTGEAYFEVAHNKLMPFHVLSRGQDVEVLGTHFDIYAYTDEAAIKTTLLEGSVRLTQITDHLSGLLKPGQQAVNTGHGFQIKEADTEEAVAWKNGYFRFNGENITAIMQKLSRWYDMDIKYQGPVSGEKFYGTISRYKNISEVLEMLEETKDVKIIINGRTVTVSADKNITN